MSQQMLDLVQMMNKFTTTVKEMAENQNKSNIAIMALNAKINALEAKVAEQGAKIIALEAKVVEHEAKVVEHEAKVVDLVTKVVDLASGTSYIIQGEIKDDVKVSEKIASKARELLEAVPEEKKLGKLPYDPSQSIKDNMSDYMDDNDNSYTVVARDLLGSNSNYNTTFVALFYALIYMWTLGDGEMQDGFDQTKQWMLTILHDIEAPADITKNIEENLDGLFAKMASAILAGDGSDDEDD